MKNQAHNKNIKLHTSLLDWNVLWATPHPLNLLQRSDSKGAPAPLLPPLSSFIFDTFGFAFFFFFFPLFLFFFLFAFLFFFFSKRNLRFIAAAAAAALPLNTSPISSSAVAALPPQPFPGEDDP